MGMTFRHELFLSQRSWMDLMKHLNHLELIADALKARRPDLKALVPHFTSQWQWGCSCNSSDLLDV